MTTKWPACLGWGCSPCCCLEQLWVQSGSPQLTVSSLGIPAKGQVRPPRRSFRRDNRCNLALMAFLLYRGPSVLLEDEPACVKSGWDTLCVLSGLGTPAEGSIWVVIPRGRRCEVTFDGTRVSCVGTRWGEEGREGAAAGARHDAAVGLDRRETRAASR